MVASYEDLPRPNATPGAFGMKVGTDAWEKCGPLTTIVLKTPHIQGQQLFEPDAVKCLQNLYY